MEKSVILKPHTGRGAWRKAVTALYLEAFPPEERMPVGRLLRLSSHREAELLGVYADAQSERLLGFCQLMSMGKAHYLNYFAIQSDLRGQGVGTAVLQALQQRYGKDGFFLALEKQDDNAPNAAQRKARRAFYTRCGLRDFPMDIQEGGVVFDTMGCGSTVDAETYNRLVRKHLGLLLTKLVPLRATQR